MTPSLIDCFQNMSLRKGDTFHHPHKNDEIFNPLERKISPSMPKRGTTCPKSLEDLLIGSGERRAADLLARVDRAIATQSKLALGKVLSEPEVLPVPTFMVNEVTLDDTSALKERTRQHRHSHSSDSGIGSSVVGSAEVETGELPLQKPALGISANHSSEANSASSPTLIHLSAATEERGLSKYASEQIHKHIIKPILREESLKEFHPLIKDVPHKIGNKDIKNLRDLEKSLIFLAPVSDRNLSAISAFSDWCSGVKDYSRSPSKYLQFCERTIRVLHTTVTTLHESDQRAPADRPYTQGYFFDLVEQVRLGPLAAEAALIDLIVQIRRYATILAATREKQARGEKTDEMDYQE